MKTRPRAAAGLLSPWFAVAVAGSLVLSCLHVIGAQPTREKMSWVGASDPDALCNDFTQASYFIRRNRESSNWVVFLESGGLCYSPDSCNRRFFVRSVREREDIRNDSLPEIIPYGRFDPFNAWNRTVFNGRSAARDTVSPLMTSMKCFVGNSVIEGRDILDTDSMENPLFHDYNHVLIPYCSSDLWLGEENISTNAVNTSSCSCFNYTTGDSNGCFNFHNAGDDLLFTFRGKTIYQSVIKQLMSDGLNIADKVILAGSSAGGLGVVNHAKWTRSRLDDSTELNVLFDSSWFIDYQDGIESVFNLESSRNSSTSDRLLDTIRSNEACNDMDRFGYPCCVSAHCVLTQRNSSGLLQYYPDGTPTFALFSIYDIYLLSPGLATVANLQTSTEDPTGGPGMGSLGAMLDILRIAGEYGGTMNNTLDVVTTQVSFLSYYVTQCFQHIYLATSTLWGEGGIFGSDSLEFTRGTSSFRCPS